MRTTARSCVSVALLVGALILPSRARTQDESTTMREIIKQAVIVTAGIELLDQEVVHVECDIVSAGNTRTIYRELHSGWTYIAVEFADWRVADLDIVVYGLSGDTWVEVARDTKKDDSPVVAVTPSRSAMYRIDVRAYRFKPGYTSAHYGLVISHQVPK